MLLFTLLLLKLSLFGLHNFEVGLPSFFTVEYHLSSCIYTISYFGEGIISASTAYSHFLITDPVFLPTEVALVDESSDAADLSAVEGE